MVCRGESNPARRAKRLSTALIALGLACIVLTVMWSTERGRRERLEGELETARLSARLNYDVAYAACQEVENLGVAFDLASKPDDLAGCYDVLDPPKPPDDLDIPGP